MRRPVRAFAAHGCREVPKYCSLTFIYTTNNKFCIRNRHVWSFHIFILKETVDVKKIKDAILSKKQNKNKKQKTKKQQHNNSKKQKQTKQTKTQHFLNLI